MDTQTDRTIAPIDPTPDILLLKMLEEKSVHVKEITDIKIKQLDEKYDLINKYEIKVRDLEFAARDLAREHQALIYEQRLQNLNHENERLQKILSESIPREVHQRDMDSVRAEIKVNNDWRIAQMGTEQGRTKTQESSVAWIKWILPAIISIILLAFAIYNIV